MDRAIVGVLGFIFKPLTNWLQKKWQARNEFGEIKRDIRHCTIVNNLPVELYKLRKFVIRHNLCQSRKFEEFFDQWLSNPIVELGQPVLIPGYNSEKMLLELHALPRWIW